MAQWIQLTSLFHQLCIQEGFEVDPSRAKDIASVLRLPGTIHQKSGNMVQLLADNGNDWSLETFQALITAKLQATPTPLPVSVSTRTSNMHPLAGLMGMGPEPPKADAEKNRTELPTDAHDG